MAAERLSAASLAMGYGGLDLAAEAVLPIELEWCAEIEPAACDVIEARWPSLPNVGDIKAVDWKELPAVDVLTAGY